MTNKPQPFLRFVRSFYAMYASACKVSMLNLQETRDASKLKAAEADAKLQEVARRYIKASDNLKMLPFSEVPYV